MIVVDSSVWIANLHDRETDAVRKLRAIGQEDQILVGDLILLEVLQGARDELHASRIERDMRQFDVVPVLSDVLAVKAARNYRLLRQHGITVRKTVDIIVATFCIEHNYELLHDDRDFPDGRAPRPSRRVAGVRTSVPIENVRRYIADAASAPISTTVPFARSSRRKSLDFIAAAA